jgi:hypothetical protein
VQLDSEWVIGHAFDVIMVIFNSMFGAYGTPDIMRNCSNVLVLPYRRFGKIIVVVLRRFC